jgi:hypothetical protein
VFVAFVIHYAMSMSHIAVCGLPGDYYTCILPHYATNGTIVEKTVIEHKK